MQDTFQPPHGSRLMAAIELIDGANADDPATVTVDGESGPLALLQGQLAYRWITRLVSEPSEELLIAARAHHLRRWELARASYPEGRVGYRRWRRDQKKRHSGDIARTMEAVGFGTPSIQRATELTLRDRLGDDPETQALEDAACLVFIETQLSDMAQRLEHDKLMDVIQRTIAKMSPQAVNAVADMNLSESERDLLSNTVAE